MRYPTNSRSQPKKLLAFYKLAAFTTFHVLLLLVALNLVLAGYFSIRSAVGRPPGHPQVAHHRDLYSDVEAYTRISPDDVARFLHEQDAMGSLGVQYAPWVQFRNPPFHGKYLNADPRGFRLTAAPRRSSPNPVRVWVFGGSTTFGYGVPDDHTIPSYLQKLADQERPGQPLLVRNRGQAFYYSSQELLLFFFLLREGEIPQAAVFLDGLNDTGMLARERDEPYFTGTLRRLWENRAGIPAPRMTRDWTWIPMVRLAREVAGRVPPPAASDETPQRDSARSYTEVDTRRITDYVVSRYTNNVKALEAICGAYHIQCRFVWQPSPFHKYDRRLHKRFPYDGPVPEYWSHVYERMKEYRNPHYAYLGDMFADGKVKVFVDDVHYNEVTSEKIAARILELLRLD